MSPDSDLAGSRLDLVSPNRMSGAIAEVGPFPTLRIIEVWNVFAGVIAFVASRSAGSVYDLQAAAIADPFVEDE
jgi:hypothetical protein